MARELQRREIPAIVPTLDSNPESSIPYWKQHARIVSEAIRGVPENEPIILVGHSGAGLILPAVRREISRPVGGYIFVDAGIPRDGKSRLDLFDRDAGEQFRRSAVQGLLPTWTDADLAKVIPDENTRATFVAELQPLPLAVYEEPLPVFEGWPDAPCGFIAFTTGGDYVYQDALTHAKQHGWPCAKIEGAHFHMLVDPAEVADALVSVAGQIGLRI